MYMCVCVFMCVCVDMLNVFRGMRAYKCTVYECMYALCTRFHFRNNARVLYVSVCVLCRCVTNIWCTGCLHNTVCAQVCTFMHMYTFTVWKF